MNSCGCRGENNIYICCRHPKADSPCLSGYVEHPPNTDRTEVRNSLTVEFLGTPTGSLLVHLFNDGTIKTREQMYAENNERMALERRLVAAESRFPQLRQTPTRAQAHARMLLRITRLRNDRTMSIIAKQTEKRNAEEEYETLLRAQARERSTAAAQVAQERRR